MLNTAERILGARGYHDVTVEEIADASEVPVAMVRELFESKDALFLQVMGRRGAELIAEMRHLLDREGSPAEALHALADLEIGFFRRHPSFGRLFVSATGAPVLNLKATLGDGTLHNYDEAMTLQMMLFERGQAAGELIEGRPEILAEVFSGIVLAFQAHDPETLGGRGEEPLDFVQMHRLLERAFVVNNEQA